MDFFFTKRELSWLDDLMPESKKKKLEDAEKEVIKHKMVCVTRKKSVLLMGVIQRQLSQKLLFNYTHMCLSVLQYVIKPILLLLL